MTDPNGAVMADPSTVCLEPIIERATLVRVGEYRGHFPLAIGLACRIRGVYTLYVPIDSLKSPM